MFRLKDSTNKFSFSGRLRSFKYAIEGLELMLKSQHNAWVHLALTIFVIISGFIFVLTSFEWIAIITAIVLVWVSEGLNTAFELLCDVTTPEFHPIVKKAKDVSAGAVLISAIGAASIGLIVFIPHMYKIFY